MSGTEDTSPARATTGSDARSDVGSLREVCDQLVSGSADPGAARALVVAVWALGAASADDLLDDLCDAAATGAERTGAPLDAADLLELLGRPGAAARLRGAVERGLDAHERTAREVARAERAVLAARAVARIATTVQHRRAAGARAA